MGAFSAQFNGAATADLTAWLQKAGLYQSIVQQYEGHSCCLYMYRRCIPNEVQLGLMKAQLFF